MFQVWANTQASDEITLTRFDFTRACDWLPLFNTNVHTPTNSVQRPVIYQEFSELRQLEAKIGRKLWKRICKLRGNEATIWNRHASLTLKNAAARFENNSMHGRDNFEVFHDIKGIVQNYLVSWVSFQAIL